MTAVAEVLATAERRHGARWSYEEAVIGGRFAGYAFHRLRGFVLATLIGHGTHVLELWLFLSFLATQLSHRALRIKLVLSLVSGSWWGALELQRRALRRRDQAQEAVRLQNGWVTLGVLLSMCVCVYAFVRALLAHDLSTNVTEALVLSWLLRLAIELPVRAYYSGVYARGRVWRPLVLSPAIEALGLFVAYLAFSAIGGVGLVLGSLATSLAAQGVTLWLSRRQYLERDLPPPRISWRAFIRLTRSIDGKALALACVGGASLRIGELFALVYLLRRSFVAEEPIEIFVFFYLAAPALTTSIGWLQTFYPDLVRCADERLAILRRRFLRALVVTGLGVGLFAWLVGALPLTFFHIASFTEWLLFVPLFMALPIFAVAQMDDFSAGRFVTMAARSAALASVATVFARLLRRYAETLEWPATIVGMSAAIGAALIIGALFARLFSHLSARRVPADHRQLDRWLVRQKRPFDVVLLRFSGLSFSDAAAVLAEVPTPLAFVPLRGVIAVLLDPNAAFDPSPFVVASAGQLTDVQRIPCPNGEVAVALFDRPQPPIGPGIVVDLQTKTPQEFLDLDAALRQTVLRSAISGRTPRRFPLQVRAVEENGRLRLIVINRR